MTEATAGYLIDVLDAAADERGHFENAAEVADELGIRGILNRVGGPRISPAPEGDRVFAVVRDETLLEARADLARLLEPRDVPYLVYKGGALLGAQYQTGDVYMSDLDVLVPLSARDRAAAAFEAHGWRRMDPVGGPVMTGAPGAVFERPFADGAISALDVDVHWLVAPVDRLFPWRGEPLPEEVWRAAVSSDLVPMPRPGHHAALLVHHLVRHDLLHFRSVFDLVQLWPGLLLPSEGRAFTALAASLGVAHTAGRLCRVLETDLGLAPLGPEAPRSPSGRAQRELRSVRGLIDLALDASERDFEAMTLSRGLRRLTTIDHPLRASRTLLRDALAPPDEYLRWRWPATRGPIRRIRHLGRVFGRLTEDDSTAPLQGDLPEIP